MNKISTQNLTYLANIEELKDICRALSALDAIISPEWQYRYYSYQKNWDDKEEFFEMRNGSGDEMKILFSKNGCVINGFAHESQMCVWKEIEIKEEKPFFEKIFGDKKKKTKLIKSISKGVLDSLPNEFHNFIFGEPVKSSGTTFCVWRKSSDAKWNVGQIEYPNDDYLDGSNDLLQLLDGNPSTYKNWAEEYYEESFENSELKLELVENVFNNTIITKKLINQINPELDDYIQLKSDLDEIGYEHKL